MSILSFFLRTCYSKILATSLPMGSVCLKLVNESKKEHCKIESIQFSNTLRLHYIYIMIEKFLNFIISKHKAFVNQKVSLYCFLLHLKQCLKLVNNYKVYLVLTKLKHPILNYPAYLFLSMHNCKTFDL